MPNVRVPAGARGALVEVQVIGVDGKPKGEPEIICGHADWKDQFRCKVLKQCHLRENK